MEYDNDSGNCGGLMEKYNPLRHSVVQAITNEPFEVYEVSDFVEAVFFAVLKELGRVYWNCYQTEWRQDSMCAIPGFTWRSFRYGDECGCPQNADGDVIKHLPSCILCLPNFEFHGVAFRWYKYPGRGMSVNKDMTPQECSEWLGLALTRLRTFDDEGFEERINS